MMSNHYYDVYLHQDHWLEDLKNPQHKGYPAIRNHTTYEHGYKTSIGLGNR